MRLRRTILAMAAVTALLATAPARAIETPYDNQLLRLSEVLGSVHFLSNLCGEKSDVWRERMLSLLQAEGPEDERRSNMIARFNHGYRSFQAIYRRCTPSARHAFRRYMDEGAKISDEMVLRYGN
ncbi:TIGR02301 family protein [Nitratireductor basaltis]|uniref:TIGR02301 family protein n=1 Tax=Nitratireductor basaltis TaxID=472175 RepID=A0A084UC87_9HYPH|nr:TIGR02301 family protein [Nitratireductor basaltis]KFB10573.1 hypothetical protein EL18_01610 [Nitratireductor basaltis]